MAGMTVYINVNVKDPDAYRALSEKMTAFVTDNEPGTTTYEWHLSEDGTKGFNIDGYDSTESFLTHMSNAQEHGFLESFLGAADIERVVVTGSPSADADPLIEQFGAEVYDTVRTL